MALSPRSLARTSLPSLIALCALPVPMLLYVLDCWTWLETGSGNANFIYFQCLAYQTFVANICIDFCGASIKRDKVLRMTEKMIRGDDVAAEK
jgi:GPI transamidase subunit PIG-U